MSLHLNECGEMMHLFKPFWKSGSPIADKQALHFVILNKTVSCIYKLVLSI